jgi:hypothetical protein
MTGHQKKIHAATDLWFAEFDQLKDKSTPL